MTRYPSFQECPQSRTGAGRHRVECPLPLHECLRNLAAPLRDPDLPVRWSGRRDRETSVKCFKVYRTNVVGGPIEALKATYPALRRGGRSEIVRLIRHEATAGRGRTPASQCSHGSSDAMVADRAWSEKSHSLVVQVNRNCGSRVRIRWH